MSEKKGLSYKDAGVDIEAGDAFIDVIKPLANMTLSALIWLLCA